MKLLKVIGIIFIVILLAIAAGIATIWIVFPPEKIKAMVLPQVEQAIGRQIKVGKIGFSFYPVFGISIKNLSVANTLREGFSKEPFITLEEFLLKVKIPPLFRKKLEIAAIIFRQPSILVEAATDGTFNFSDMTFLKNQSQKSSIKDTNTMPPVLPIPLSLERFSVEKAKLVFDDKKNNRKIVLGEINQRVDFSIDKELKDIKSSGELIISDISLTTKELPKPLSNVTVTLNHNVAVNMVAAEMQINSIRASLQKVYVNLSGNVKNFNINPQFDILVKTDKILLSDLMAEIPPEINPELRKTKASGTLEVAATLAGTIEPSKLPKISGTLLLTDGFIQYAGLAKSINNINVDIDFTENSLTARKIGLMLAENPVTIIAFIENFVSPKVDVSVDAKVDLGTLKDIVKLEQVTSINGLVNADIKASGLVDPKNPASLDMQGKVILTNITATTPALAKPAIVNGTVDMTSKSIEAKINTSIASSFISINGKVVDFLTLVLPDPSKKCPRPKLTFSVTSPLIKPDEFLAQTQKDNASTKEPTKKPSDMPLLAAPLPGVDIQGTITCGKLVYNIVEFNNFKAIINCVNDIMKVDITSGLHQGMLSTQLLVDATQINNLKIKNSLNIDKLKIDDFIGKIATTFIPENLPPLFGELKKLDKSIAGNLILKTEVAMNGSTVGDLTKSLSGTLYSKLLDGKIFSGSILEEISSSVSNFYKLGEINFKDMRIRASFANESLIFDSLNFISPLFGDWNGHGKIGFDCKLDFTLANRLTQQLSKPIIGIQNNLKSQGKAALSGTPLASFASAIDNSGIPVDAENRVTLLLKLGGTTFKPAVSFQGFGKTDAASTQPSVQQMVTQQISEELTKKKQELEQQARLKIEEEKKRLEAEAKAKEEEARLQAEAAKQKAKQELEQQKLKIGDDAKKKLKKIF